MAWNPTLTSLRSRLATLFPQSEDARRIVEEAGLDPAYISFDAKAVNNWHNILGQAELRGKVEPLVIAVLQDHRGDQALIDAYTAYMTALGQSADLPAELLEAPTTPPRSTSGSGQATAMSTTHINTGGGPYIAGNVSTDGGDFVGRDIVNNGAPNSRRGTASAALPRSSRLAAIKREQLETELDDLERRWRAVTNELRTSNDVVARDRLELQRSQLEEEMGKVETELNELA